jgi:hypothetical protein
VNLPSSLMRSTGVARAFSSMTLLLALLVAGLVPAMLVPASARADLRIWEQNADDATHHRWFAVTGFAQPGFIVRQNDPENPISDDHFWLQRARFGFRTQLHRYLQLRFELEGMPSPNLTDVFVDLPIHPAFSVRAGQFLLPFLRTYQINEANQAFIDRTVYTPQQPDRFALRYLNPRDVGIMFTGIVGNSDPEVVSPGLQYWVGAFLGRGANQIVNDDSAFLYSARVNLHVLGPPKGADQESDLAHNEHAHVAAGAGIYTNCDDRGNYNRGLTFDTEFRFRGLYAYASFVRFYNGAVRNDSLGRALGYDTGCGSGIAGASDHVAWGASVQAQYVLPRAVFPVESQALEVLARFDAVAPLNPADGSFLGGGSASPGYAPPPDYRDADNPPSRWRLTFGLNWFPTREQILRVSANYQLNRETENAVIAGREFVGVKNDVFWLQGTVGF